MTTVSGTTSASSSVSSSASSALSENYTNFLTLLTTQLKNQSPDDPMDTNEMTSQLVQFSSVEQQIAMNKNLETLISLQQTSQLAATQVLGRTIEVESSQLALQDGAAQAKLPAAGSATTAHVAVQNGSGATLYEEDVKLGRDSTVWNWDGRTGGGTQLADGAYTLKVTGTDSAGNATDLGFTVLARATSVERDGTSMTLLAGKASYDFNDIRSITN